MQTIFGHNFESIISIENILKSWEEFLRGKRDKKDVQEFSLCLMTNILALRENLTNKTYCHGGYESFYVNDPKRRHINKASVRDRLLHHAVYRILYSFFDTKFIADSFSCRLDKGTHKAINRFRQMACVVSKNHTRTCWVLKCDIRKFFASIDHNVLLGILKKNIADDKILWLLENIIGSFKTSPIGFAASPLERGKKRTGLPLGNLTSQLFTNIYMNEFDQWVKRELKVKYYIRYADDFVFLSQDRDYLELIVPVIDDFLQNRLRLFLHPGKVFIKTINSGVDFLGWVNFMRHRVLRTATKNRMLRRLGNGLSPGQIESYLGLLGHGDAYKLQRKIKERLIAD